MNFFCSWIDLKNLPHSDLCAIFCGRILWKILEMKRMHRSILLIILLEDAHISIGKLSRVFFRA